MGLSSTTVGEMQQAGSPTNGTFFNPASAGDDFSQQTTAKVTVTDGVANGTTTITSVTGGFTTFNIVGNGLHDSGTSQWYEIITVTDDNTLVVDRNVTTGTGLTFNIGGAVDNFTTALLDTLTGNDLYVGPGTYTLAGGVIPTADGLVGKPNNIIGYNSSRSVRATGLDRPLIVAAANAFTLDNYWHMANLRGTTTHANGFDLDNNPVLDNCHFNNTSGSAGRFALGFQGATRPKILYTELQSVAGTGIVFYGTGLAMDNCFVHDCAIVGISHSVAGSASCITNSVVVDNGIGIQVASNDHNISGCIIDGNTTGVDIASGTIVGVVGNQITNNTTGVNCAAVQPGAQVLQDNNWQGNGTDQVNATKGTGATANDPGYTSAGTNDYSNTSTDVIGADTVIAGSLTPNQRIRGAYQRIAGGGEVTTAYFSG